MSDMPPPPNEVTNFPVDNEWLAGAEPEEVLEPDLPIVDAHHHLLDRPDLRYLVPDLEADIAEGHNVVATVHVEGGNNFARSHGPRHLRVVGETEVVASMTTHCQTSPPKIAAGIVNYADLSLGAAVGEVLDTHIALGLGRFVGVRQLTIWDDDPSVRMFLHAPRRPLSPGMMAEPAFREGYRELGARKLAFDATVFHTQLSDLADLARAVPQTRLIVDHLGCVLRVGPYAGKTDAVFADWKRDLAALAQLPNIYVKVGGLGMRMFGFDFRARPAPPTSRELETLWRPFVETAVDLFGVKRTMLESNFPVDKGYFSYRTCWNAFKRLTAGASAEEKAALYSGTATSAYRLLL